MNKTTVNIDVLGKTYQVKCPENEVESLKKAATLLEEKMRVTRDGGIMLSNDRIAVITSLNLAHQLLVMEETSHEWKQTIHHRLQNLQGKVDTALAQQAEMELATVD